MASARVQLSPGGVMEHPSGSCGERIPRHIRREILMERWVAVFAIAAPAATAERE